MCGKALINKPINQQTLQIDFKKLMWFFSMLHKLKLHKKNPISCFYSAVSSKITAFCEKVLQPGQR
jgi:hypothetical protein